MKVCKNVAAAELRATVAAEQDKHQDLPHLATSGMWYVCPARQGTKTQEAEGSDCSGCQPLSVQLWKQVPIASRLSNTAARTVWLHVDLG